jgi:hypothetical protein
MSDGLATMTVVDRYKSATCGVLSTCAVVRFDGISNRDEFEAAFPLPSKPTEPAPYPHELIPRELVRVPTNAVIKDVAGGIWFDSYDKEFRLMLNPKDVSVLDLWVGTEIELLKRFWSHWGVGGKEL